MIHVLLQVANPRVILQRQCNVTEITLRPSVKNLQIEKNFFCLSFDFVSDNYLTLPINLSIENGWNEKFPVN